jgi:hypothetical protein
MSGWSNYSGIVTSQEMIERKMDNRGSKSITYNNPASQFYVIVKEQRVDGSYIERWTINNKFSMLRCTLMDFERNYQTKTLSNRNFQLRNYSSNSLVKSNYLIESNFKGLSPWFITGFSDAECSFSVTIRKNPRGNTWWVDHRYSIGLHIKDLALLQLIQEYFGGIGRILEDPKKARAELRVSSLEELVTVILPHFNTYNLITKKQADFLLFREILLLKKDKEHLTKEGLQNLVNLRATLNLGLSNELALAFPNTKPVTRPVIDNINIPHPDWVAGFTSGEGSFLIGVHKSTSYTLGANVKLTFQLTQHSRDELLMRSLINYFGCGNYEIKKEWGNFLVTKFSDNYEKIIPFFKTHPVRGVKSLDFQDWCLAGELIKIKAHLKSDGLEQLLKIKAGVNKGRLWNKEED